MSLLTPDSGLLFWMVIVFGIVFVILAKYGFPVITRMVDERKLQYRYIYGGFMEPMTVREADMERFILAVTCCT